MVKNPPCDAGDTASIPPWSGKIPYASEQQSPWATAPEACTLEHKMRSHCSEKSEHHN